MWFRLLYLDYFINVKQFSFQFDQKLIELHILPHTTNTTNLRT